MGATDFLAANFEAVPALIVACLEMRTVKRRMLAQLGPAARSTVGLGVRDALSLARNFSHLSRCGESAAGCQVARTGCQLDDLAFAV